MQNNEMLLVNSVSETIHTVIADGEPWFNFPNVCGMLDIGNPRQKASKIPDTNKKKWALLSSVTDNDALDIPHNLQPHTTYVNEAGLYHALTFSKKPGAREIVDWMFGEAVPAARQRRVAISFTDWKNGVRYKPEMPVSGIDVMAVLQDPSFTKAALLTIEGLQKDKQELTLTVCEQSKMIVEKTQVIETMEPKADFYDKVLSSPDTLTPTQIGKDIGRSGPWINAALKHLGFHWRVHGQWVPMQEYAGRGYTRSEMVLVQGGSKCVKQTTFTQKGQEFVFALLQKRMGITPGEPFGNDLPGRKMKMDEEIQYLIHMHTAKMKEEAGRQMTIGEANVDNNQ